MVVGVLAVDMAQMNLGGIVGGLSEVSVRELCVEALENGGALARRSLRRIIADQYCLSFVCSNSGCYSKFSKPQKGNLCPRCGWSLAEETHGLALLPMSRGFKELFGRRASVALIEAYRAILFNGEGNGIVQNLEGFCREHNLDKRQFYKLKVLGVVDNRRVGQMSVWWVRKDFVENNTRPLRRDEDVKR